MPDATPQAERFVDASTVATYLSITKRQTLKLARSGKLPSHPLTPTLRTKTYRFLLSEVEAFVLGAHCAVAGKLSPNSVVPKKAKKGN